MINRKRLLAALGRNVRRQREARGLTQKELGELAGLAPSYISSIERGKRNPGLNNVARLGKALAINVSRLFQGIDY